MNENCRLLQCSPAGGSALTAPKGYEAINAIMRVIGEQSQPTFDENFKVISYYHWTGIAPSPAPEVNNGGNGEPKGYTGLVGTHHRPSDDLTIYRKELQPVLWKYLLTPSSLFGPSECHAQR
jgi:meiotically up-regulated gene 157 (Mug157) protein